MEAKELMIGDWVADSHGYIRVDIDALNWINEYPLEPIPLTPEILEKNGFENNGYGDYILNKEDYFVGWSIIHRTIRVIMSNGYNYEAKDVFIPCEDVKTLQHALRLCGLNELADYFKVV